jgi:hypothetical protein
MVAEPMLRAGNPETVAESKRTGACPAAENEHSRAPVNIMTTQQLRADAFIFTSHLPIKDFLSATLLAAQDPAKLLTQI